MSLRERIEELSAANKQEFEDLFERAFPPVQPRLPLVVEVDANEVDKAA